MKSDNIIYFETAYIKQNKLLGIYKCDFIRTRGLWILYINKSSNNMRIRN